MDFIQPKFVDRLIKTMCVYPKVGIVLFWFGLKLWLEWNHNNDQAFSCYTMYLFGFFLTPRHFSNTCFFSFQPTVLYTSLLFSSVILHSSATHSCYFPFSVLTLTYSIMKYDIKREYYPTDSHSHLWRLPVASQSHYHFCVPILSTCVVTPSKLFSSRRLSHRCHCCCSRLAQHRYLVYRAMCLMISGSRAQSKLKSTWKVT